MSQATYRPLGKSGLQVSTLSYGAMTVGQDAWGGFPTETDLEASFKLFNVCKERGINLYDTANVYGSGSSETCLGLWVKTLKSRDEVLIATKGCGRTGPGPNNRGNSRRNLTKSLEASLERLGTNYVDLYQVHAFDLNTPIRETLLTLNDFVRSGKVRYVGVSNWSAWQLSKAATMISFMDLEPIISIQQQYSLLERQLELDIGDVCQLEGVGILPGHH